MLSALCSWWSDLSMVCTVFSTTAEEGRGFSVYPGLADLCGFRSQASKTSGRGAVQRERTFSVQRASDEFLLGSTAQHRVGG